MLSDFSAFVYSGRQFNDSKLLELATAMPLPGPHATVILEHDRQVNLGTGNISAERQRRLAARWTLLGSDAILLPNTPISRSLYEDAVTKMTNGMELGKIAVQSSSVRSSSHSSTPLSNDSLKIPSLILFGVNASLNF